MNIVILGAGAVGGYLGARLLEAEVPVSFLVREKRAEWLKQRGLRLKSVHGDYMCASPPVCTRAEDIPACDVVILAVKSYHVEGTLKQLRILVDKGAKVLPFLNGMEHYRLLSKELGEENVLGGLAFIISTLDENGGVVQISDQHDFVFGPLHSSQEQVCREFEDSLHSANLNVMNSGNILTELWQKYSFITAFSGITTASRLPIGKVRSIPETQRLFKKMLEEMKSLSEVYNIELGRNFIDITLEKTSGLPEEATSSMHQDFRKGLPIEIEGLHGGALRMARDFGIELPVIQTVYGLLKPFEKGK